MAIEEEAARWAVRMDRGLSSNESEVLEDWLEGDSRRRGALLRARAAWSMLDRARALAPIGGTAEPQHATIGRRQLLKVGGGIAALVAASAAWHLVGRGETYHTVTGEIRRVALEDGSLAIVNTDSGVRFRYNKIGRDVELSRGEAWFHVAKNKERPFTVAAGAMRIQAVGTAFDVRRREEMSEIVVTDGRVKVWSVRSDEAPIYVVANQRAVINDRMGVQFALLSPEQSGDQLAWREGRIVFDEVTLAQAADEFNRYNRIKLTVAAALADQRIVGSFHVDDVDGFVKACATLTNARVERSEGTIAIF